jgi:hypothetical protein
LKAFVFLVIVMVHLQVGLIVSVSCLGDTGPGVDLTVMEQQELGYMSLRDDFERVFTHVCDSAVVNLSL